MQSSFGNFTFPTLAPNPIHKTRKLYSARFQQLAFRSSAPRAIRRPKLVIATMPMDEFITPEDIPDLQPLSPEKPLNRSTGPKTPAGKARSSMNRLTHGCRSQKTVLPDEDPAEFEFTIQAWFDHYGPAQGGEVAGVLQDDELAGMLVYETALAHWHLKRNRTRLEEIECRLPGDAWQWTPNHIQLFTTFSRYKTAAERTFARRFKEVEAYYTRLHRREHLDQLAFAKLAAIDLKWLNKQEQATAKKLKFEQVVEVEILEGRCQTSYYPTNQEMLEWAAKRPEKPLYMSRFIVFPDGVPSEYAWTNATPTQTTGTLHAVQKMSWERWLEVIEHEKSLGTGHIGPCRSIFQDK
jgi:hypothetical protein